MKISNPEVLAGICQAQIDILKKTGYEDNYRVGPLLKIQHYLRKCPEDSCEITEKTFNFIMNIE